LIEKATNFTEEREKTIERENSFRHWPHSSPSRIDMVKSGWSLDTTKGKDFTICPYCGVECNNWKPNDNPLRIHRGWSKCCPFVLSEHPMRPSPALIQSLKEILTDEKIAEEVVKPTSNIILASNSPYAHRPTRAESFVDFPIGLPSNVDALVASGFYCVGIHTLLRCYNCGEAVNDFHEYSSNEINAKHYERFPHCRFAKFLVEQGKTRSMSKLYRYSIER
jgi:hypothetical protein